MARYIKRAYVFMSGARRNRWTKQLFRGETRYGRGRASKLAEDSHKGINRRRYKSDRRGSVRKLLARWHDEQEMLENPCFWTSVRSQGGRSLITRADSRGIVNPR